MRCQGCGNETAIHVRVRYVKGKKQEICDRCGGIGAGTLADGYCPQGGYFDENLADSEHRRGQFVRDKRHKSELLRKLGLEEAGQQRNATIGKVTPFIKDTEKRRKYCLDNFGC